MRKLADFDTEIVVNNGLIVATLNVESVRRCEHHAQMRGYAHGTGDILVRGLRPCTVEGDHYQDVSPDVARADVLAQIRPLFEEGTQIDIYSVDLFN